LIHFWRQPELVWIYPPAGDFIAQAPRVALAAQWAAESLFLLRASAGDVGYVELGILYLQQTPSNKAI